MRVILILSLLPIAVAAARAENPASPTSLPPPAIATATAEPIAPASAPAQVAVPAQVTLPQPIVAPVPPNVSLSTAGGSKAADAAAPAPAPSQVPTAEPGHRKRLTMEEHFDQANVAHDGHLTLDEAKAGYRSLVRHFANIDATHKGYVTVDDIRTWRAQQRAARSVPRSSDGSLHPRPAYEPGMSIEHRSFNTRAAQTVGNVPDALPGAAATPAAQ